MKFCNLKFYSEFSDDKGIVKIKEIIKKTTENKQNYLCITDNNFSGSFEFFSNSIKSNLKPILGCEIKVNCKFLDCLFVGNITLIVKNLKGYKSVCKILSKKKKIHNLKYVLKHKGLIVLSGGYGGLYTDIINRKINFLKHITNKIININKRFYIEIQRFNKDSYFETKKLIKLKKNNNFKLVATQPVRFLNKKDFYLFKFRYCIINKKFYSEDNFLEKYKYNFFDKKLYKKFIDVPKSIYNSIKIAKLCNFKFDVRKKISFFKKKKKRKFKNKIFKIFIKFLKNKEYKYYKRLKLEYKTIKKIGFLDYFIIVYDFVVWAKKRNIIKGPGRGSGSSSLIAYVLGITDINPIRYNLIFERFLNIKKSSLPDFDIDFCKKKRKKVINYLKKKYGRNKVVNIVTFGKFSIKNSIRDSGRVLGYGYNYSNNISKKLNDYKIENLKIFINNNLYYKKKYFKNYKFRKIINFSYKLEDLIRNKGIHAGGLVILKKNFYNFFPLYNIEKKNKTIKVCQFNKFSVEKMGFIKFDILGLNTLSVISNIIKKIGIKFNFDLLNLKDQKTYNIIKKGKTTCIFQLENYNLMKYLKVLKPNNVNDIINIIALYRPGPINLIKKYCSGGIKNYFLNNESKKILKKTRGIIIFQEQLIQLLKINAGYSLNEADIFRNLLSKKSEIKSLKIDFFKKRNILNKNLKKTKLIFDFIKKFSGYSFNKAHAVSYSYITLTMAWLKANYNIQFYVSNLNFSYNNKNKLKRIYRDCFLNKIEFLLPNINNSGIYFNSNNNKIEFGLIAIKGVGKKALKNIIKKRKKSLFIDFDNFCSRINRSIVNKRIIKILIYCGCFDSFESRECLINKLKFISNKNTSMQKCYINQKTFFKKNNKKNNKESYKKNAIKENKYMCFFFSVVLYKKKTNLKFFCGFLIFIYNKKFKTFKIEGSFLRIKFFYVEKNVSDNYLNKFVNVLYIKSNNLNIIKKIYK
ncbi:DNA polymerase III subunit alpha [Candidatus Vidania fulgoroideorum]